MLQLPNVVGHRGAAAYAPENTLASFREAKRRGAEWIELDVKTTRDDVPIIMHDESFLRTTGVDRLVIETDGADLPVGVPTFAEAIACLVELDLGCNVEIKPCPGREAATARAAIETLRRCWPAHLPPPLLSSFKDASLAAAREMAPEYARALLLREATPDWRQRAAAVAAIGLTVNGRNLGALWAHDIKRADYLLGVYTINDPVEARALIAMGADFIITDAPDVILAALEA